ncbi:carcinoembryonic antigen-related cell adhesion molecule 5-like isoform X1 [Mya arenaria]|uniref:carcinoembryonic antigen-related cell adhesion molecule 5-like isoform X1 n=1 Tax=Mya arenaria TaxID=6604 RepID=UPI0022E315E6|nr:carcinoembryonic antigen-related cell adhesion molecule 5-like isoform X1 [Mya arenaria]XP_052818760.1 carcinoembryonic antigen-related cell adhesion molecule 5-like isoform X1 [Mya arenaria]
MDITYLWSVLFMVHTQIKPGISQVQLHTNGAITAVLGNNSCLLACTYSGLTPSQIQGLTLKLQKDSLWIMELSPIYKGEITHITSTFSGRISVDRFTADNPTTTITFQYTECEDEGTYTWEGSYFDSRSGAMTVTQTQDIIVKAFPVFGQADSQFSFTPNTNLAVGDKVTFTCSGDVGNNPVGVIAWFSYRNGEIVPVDESSNAISTAPQVSRLCSRSRASSLELTLTREMDKMVVRCTVQQDKRTQAGDGHIQTDTATSVMYKPVIRSIIGYPYKQLYIEGLEHLTLICNAEGNPPPSYYWMFDYSNIAGCRSLVLDNLTAAQGGAYICVAYNFINGAINNVNASTYIVIQKTTSTSVDTTMSYSTTSHTEEEGTTSDSRPDFSVGMIVGVIVGAFAVGAVGISLMLVRRCYKRRKVLIAVPEKPTYTNTELNTRSEDFTAIAEINNYDQVNIDRNDPQYQSLHQNPQLVNQIRATESDYTALDARSHENSVSMATDVPTDDRVPMELPTTSDNFTQDTVSEEALHHYQSLQRDPSACETGYSELEVTSA